MSKTATIGHIVLTEAQIDECLENNKKYIVTGSMVYEIRHVNNKPEYLPYYGSKIYMSQTSLMKNGSWKACTANEVNELIGYELLAH